MTVTIGWGAGPARLYFNDDLDMCIEQGSETTCTTDLEEYFKVVDAKAEDRGFYFEFCNPLEAPNPDSDEENF